MKRVDPKSATFLLTTLARFVIVVLYRNNYHTNKRKNMSKSARASHIASNITKGSYIKQFKFANYGSVVEDSIKAQQRQADRRLLEIQAKKAKAGCNIINGFRYKEMRDVQGHLQSIQTSSQLAGREFACSAYNIKEG